MQRYVESMRLLRLALLFSMMPLVGGASAREPADTIVTNANVRTVDAKQERAQAFAVRDGRFVYVGDAAGAERYRGERTQTIDAHGATVLPGLIDAHGHLLGLGLGLRFVSLVDVGSYEEVIARTAKRAHETAPGAWVIGRGWDQNRWTGQAFPTHEALDAAVPDHPVVLTRIDGHALLANAAAMRAAHVSAATADPVGGRLLRDATGAPTGVFIDKAKSLIESAVPQATHDEIARALQDAVTLCNRYGLTTVHDPGESRRVIDIDEELAREKKLTVRTYVMISDDDADIAYYLALGPKSGLYDGHLWIRSIKLYADGALGSRGAALLAPYTDDPANSGLLLSTQSHIEGIAERALRAGFQVGTHAIGDRANRIVLDAYAQAFHAVPEARDPRFRIEHAQILSVTDLPRFAQLGVIPSMQSSHQTSDMPWAEARVGPQRITGAYAWHSLLATGVSIANGTDFPVERVDPLITYHSAVTRENGAGAPPGGWYPRERMTRDEALRSMTIWAAQAGFQENDLGSISVGKYADFVLLDRDIVRIPAEQILAARVIGTYVGGKSVYQAP